MPDSTRGRLEGAGPAGSRGHGVPVGKVSRALLDLSLILDGPGVENQNTENRRFAEAD